MISTVPSRTSQNRFLRLIVFTLSVLATCLTSSAQDTSQTFCIDEIFVLDIVRYGIGPNDADKFNETLYALVEYEFDKYFGDSVTFQYGENITTGRRRQRGRLLLTEEEEEEEEEEEDDEEEEEGNNKNEITVVEEELFDVSGSGAAGFGTSSSSRSEEWEIPSYHNEFRRLVKVNTCPEICRKRGLQTVCIRRPWCKGKPTRRRRRRLQGEEQTVLDNNNCSETFSFNFIAAKNDMNVALQAYKDSFQAEVESALATKEDYTDMPTRWEYPVVYCKPSAVAGQVCAFRTYFGYPDIVYVSFWFVEGYANNTDVDVFDFFSTVPVPYFRTTLIVEEGRCRAAIELEPASPSFCTSCTICEPAKDERFSVDCTDLYADLGEERLGHLWKGSNTTCQSMFPVFFPLEPFHSWLPKD